MANKTQGTRQKPMHRGPSGTRPKPPTVPRPPGSGRTKFPSLPSKEEGAGVEKAGKEGTEDPADKPAPPEDASEN